MRTNYVLIDFENLQPELLEALDLEHFRVMAFMGANQSKVPLDFAAQLQRLGTRAQYLRISGKGRNALDFHIAFYLGELLAKDADAFFHVIAVDGGYDPLLQHLRDRKVFVRKYKSIADIPHVKAANSKTLTAKVSFVRELLADRQGRQAEHCEGARLDHRRHVPWRPRRRGPRWHHQGTRVEWLPGH